MDTQAITPTPLRCQMSEGCKQVVSHVDNDGFVYCEGHGLRRRHDQPCRKLRPYEIKRLQRGETIRY